MRINTRTDIVETERGRSVTQVEKIGKENYIENKSLQIKSRIVRRWKPSVRSNKRLTLREKVANNYQEFFQAIAERPGMYLVEESLACYISFISGYIAAYEEKPLLGFREWLVKKKYIGTNQTWSAVVFNITARREQERILSFHKLMSEYFQSIKTTNLVN